MLELQACKELGWQVSLPLLCRVNHELCCRATDGSLLVTNFESSFPASFYAELYKESKLTGGHVIMLGDDEASRWTLVILFTVIFWLKSMYQSPLKIAVSSHWMLFVKNFCKEMSAETRCNLSVKQNQGGSWRWHKPYACGKSILGFSLMCSAYLFAYLYFRCLVIPHQRNSASKTNWLCRALWVSNTKFQLFGESYCQTELFGSTIHLSSDCFRSNLLIFKFLDQFLATDSNRRLNQEGKTLFMKCLGL